MDLDIFELMKLARDEQIRNMQKQKDMQKRNTNFVYMPKIIKVLFQEPATIVFWNDNTKTVVKAQDGEPFDKEKGLSMAIIKKMCGNKGNYNEIFHIFCNE